jgi:hypothetical protein
MAGKTIKEARTAQRAAFNRHPQNQAAHVATSSTTNTAATPAVPPDNSNLSAPLSSIVVNGLTYFLPQ